MYGGGGDCAADLSDGCAADLSAGSVWEGVFLLLFKPKKPMVGEAQTAKVNFQKEYDLKVCRLRWTPLGDVEACNQARLH